MCSPSCLDDVLVDLVWRLFSDPDIRVVGETSPKQGKCDQMKFLATTKAA
jgi:hypothetical protein